MNFLRTLRTEARRAGMTGPTWRDLVYPAAVSVAVYLIIAGLLAISPNGY